MRTKRFDSDDSIPPAQHLTRAASHPRSIPPATFPLFTLDTFQLLNASPQALAAALELYREALPPGEVTSFRVDGVDRLGIPIYDATYIPEDATHNIYGVGYGATETEALVGAYGELCEDCFHSRAFVALDLAEGTYPELCERFGADKVIDPMTLALEAGTERVDERRLRWAPVTRFRDSVTCYCPAEFVTSYNAELPDYPDQLTTAITNGMGAGDTLERALLHGLCELLQRDGNADSFRALDQGQVIPKDKLPTEVRAIVDELAAKDLHVTTKLARVTCGCASVYAVGRDTNARESFPLSVTACGEAADPDIATALRKAVLECASAHTRKIFYHSTFERKAPHAPDGYRAAQEAIIDLGHEEPRALSAMMRWLRMSREEVYAELADTVFSERTQVDPATLPGFSDSGQAERLKRVLEGYRGEGLEVYYFDSSPRGEAGVRTVKAIVPGIEMELGSYHRIGLRGARRLLQRGDGLVSREPDEGRERVVLRPDAEAQLGGPIYLNVAELDRRVATLYPLYREPSAHAAQHALEADYVPAT